MSCTVVTTNRDRETAVVAASEVDVLSIAKAAERNSGEAVAVFTEALVRTMNGWFSAVT